MSLQIVKIHEKGTGNKEYVELKVLEACDLVGFIVSDTTYIAENTVSNRLRHMYWFLSQKVAKGDYVFLRTGKGTDTVHANTAGTKTYVRYWGLDSSVWNNTGDTAVLFALKDWSVKKA